MGYNQHQSFYLRDRWLGKGLRAINKDPRFFYQDDAFEKLGLGKNMVQSLRHWLIATGCAYNDGVGKKRKMILTPFGNWVLENDPALKYADTVAMIHYNIVYKDEPSSSWFWYFNINNESMSDKENLFIRLDEWVQEKESRVVSKNSIKRDVDVLLKMYSKGEELEDPEEVISSPFSRLNLIVEKEEMWKKNEVTMPENSLLFIKYALCKYSNEKKRYELSVEEILNDSSLIGRVYNMKSSTVLNKLIQLENSKIYKINFTRTNNLDYIILPKITEEELLAQSIY